METLFKLKGLRIYKLNGKVFMVHKANSYHAFKYMIKYIRDGVITNHIPVDSDFANTFEEAKQLIIKYLKE